MPRHQALLAVNPNAALADAGGLPAAPPRSTERVNMVELALENKVHADLLYRVTFAASKPAWRPCFVVIDDGGDLLVFDDKTDFVDFVFNPYLDDQLKELLLRRRVKTPACGPIVTKTYNRTPVTHFKVFRGTSLQCKLGGPEPALAALRQAISADNNRAQQHHRLG